MDDVAAPIECLDCATTDELEVLSTLDSKTKLGVKLKPEID